MEIIEELIKLAEDREAATKAGEETGLTTVAMFQAARRLLDNGGINSLVAVECEGAAIVNGDS